MNYQIIIDEYYPEDNELRALLLKHSRQVADKCLETCRKHPELNIDEPFVEAAAMLHDIGVRWCYAPSIFCEGREPYIRHGLIGGELLRSKGLDAYACVCERHTGTGLTQEHIISQKLPLPVRDFIPVTLEEKLVCYADKFFSKSSPNNVRTVKEAARSLEKFGNEGVEKFMKWAEMFE